MDPCCGSQILLSKQRSGPHHFHFNKTLNLITLRTDCAAYMCDQKHHIIAISLHTFTFTSFPAAGKPCSSSPRFKYSVLPCMTHEGCGPFYQLRNYKSIQQGFSGMRTFLGHRIVSGLKHHLVSLNKSIVFFISVLTVTK